MPLLKDWFGWEGPYTAQQRRAEEQHQLAQISSHLNVYNSLKKTNPVAARQYMVEKILPMVKASPKLMQGVRDAKTIEQSRDYGVKPGWYRDLAPEEQRQASVAQLDKLKKQGAPQSAIQQAQTRLAEIQAMQEWIGPDNPYYQVLENEKRETLAPMMRQRYPEAQKPEDIAYPEPKPETKTGWFKPTIGEAATRAVESVQPPDVFGQMEPSTTPYTDMFSTARQTGIATNRTAPSVFDQVAPETPKQQADTQTARNLIDSHNKANPDKPAISMAAYSQVAKILPQLSPDGQKAVLEQMSNAIPEGKIIAALKKMGLI